MTLDMPFNYAHDRPFDYADDRSAQGAPYGYFSTPAMIMFCMK
jgi:hypothetical protein